MPGIPSRVIDAMTIDKVVSITLKDLDALASSITHANEIRHGRLRFQRMADLTDPATAAALARLTFLDDEAFVTVWQAVDMAPLSARGRWEAWCLFLANRPG